MVFDYIFRLSVSWYSIVFFVIIVLHWTFGVHYLYKRWFKYKSSEGTAKGENYDHYRIKFLTEYDRCNPITLIKASNEYFSFLAGKHSILLFKV